MSECKWISVSERHPDAAARCDYLLWQEHGDGHGSCVVGYFAGGEFWLYEGDNITASEAGVTITHWMLLPQDPLDQA